MRLWAAWLAGFRHFGFPCRVWSQLPRENRGTSSSSRRFPHPAACDVGERKQPIADRGCLKTGFPAVTCTRMVAGLFVPEQFRQAGENIRDLRFPMTNPCLGRAENILLVHSLKNR